MILIFCSFPLDENKPDPDYLSEWEAAAKAGVKRTLISFEALTLEKNAQRAVNKVSSFAEPTMGLYRGWMLTPLQYEQLYEALLVKNVVLINNPAEYRHCHYLPESFHYIKEYSAETIWYKIDEQVNYDEVLALLRPFGSSPIILKDYVKSAKHSWKDACYIENALDSAEVRRVTDNFMKIRGAELNEGLVYRRFLQLKELARHSKSGIPLFLEYRIFYCKGHVVGVYPYWEEGSYPEELLSMELFNSLALNISSNFFSLDIAERDDGEPVIIELGDGQVAGLPDRADPFKFISRLSEIVNTDNS